MMFESRLGEGRIFTCLTSAGPLVSPQVGMWSNWANGPAGFSFVVLQLELAKRLIRKNRAFPQLPAGTPLQIDFSQAAFQPEVDILTPDDQVSRIQASPPAAQDGQSANTADAPLRAVFQETDSPGIYAATLTTQNLEMERRLFALNVPPIEGALSLADDSSLLRELGETTNVHIQPAGSFEWIRSESPGSEIRWFLLMALAILCILEQALASRLSYQSGT
jgi:hypothetical protein